MKKQDISGLVVYILIFCLTVVFALLVVREYFPESGMEIGPYILFVLGSFVAGIVLNAILFELAHIIGAKVGRYQITSVCILGLTFKKVNGKNKICFGPYDGLTGETKILPKTNTKKKPNPTPYLLLGTLFYAVEIIAVVFAFSFLQGATESVALHNLGYALLIVGVVGGGVLIYNILPFRLDSMTDGYRLRLVSNKKNRDAFNNLLLVENHDIKGEIDVELINSKTIDVQGAFSADIKINKIYVLLNENNLEEADKLLDEIISESNNKNSQKTYLLAKAEKIYVSILLKPIEDALKYYEENVSLSERRDIAEHNSMTCVRAYMLASALLDKSRSECTLTIKRAYKAYKRTPDSRKNLEIKLFNQALDKIVEARPNWELAQYRMNEEKKVD